MRTAQHWTHNNIFFLKSVHFVEKLFKSTYENWNYDHNLLFTYIQ